MTRAFAWVVAGLALACGTESLPAAQAARAPALAGEQQAACAGAGAHGKHEGSGIACATCHPCGGQFGFANVFTYPGGTSTAGGSITPASGTAPASCTVACHSPFGGAAHPVEWTATGPLACIACHDKATLPPAHPDVSALSSRADCEACHDVAAHTAGAVKLVKHPSTWMVEADPGFHAWSAERGLGACQQCHQQDLGGGVTGVSCASCHDTTDGSGAPVAWKTNCTLCHGGTSDSSGAPPRTIWGYSSDAVRVGAHATHLAGSALAPPLDCATCHVKPADALAPGHIDEVALGAVPHASVTFGGLGARGAPAWDRDTATCSSTYCHGATLHGGNNTAPVWTRVGEGQAACGTCHGTPPPAPHPAASGLASCNICHGMTVDPSGAVIPPALGGKHLDGILESTGGHAPSWTDVSSPDFHAFTANEGLSACTSCHGADLAGGSVGVGCGKCHDQGLPAGVSSWKQNCTMCHGGVDNQSGAPPRTTWGQQADPLRVGAHTAHLGNNPLALPVDCAECHVKPADALASGHIGPGPATMTFGGRAILSGAAPAWNRETGTCASTYCHGTYSGVFNYQYVGGDGNAEDKQFFYSSKGGTPTWTGTTLACDTCHGNPPRDGSVWHSGYHGGGNSCELCHPDAISVSNHGTSISDVTRHIDGKVDVVPRTKLSCIGCH